MSVKKKPVWKLVLLLFELIGCAGAGAFLLFSSAGRSGADRYNLLIPGICLLIWAVIAFSGISAFRKNRKAVILPCTGMQLFILILGLSTLGFMTGYNREAMKIWGAGVIGEIIIIFLYCKFLRNTGFENSSVEEKNDSGLENSNSGKPVSSTEPSDKFEGRTVPAAAVIQQKPRFREGGRLLFTASSIWNTVAQEYCVANSKNMETLNDRDRQRILEYACTPVSYFFLWAAKHDHLSTSFTNSINIATLLVDTANPAYFIREHMDSQVSLRDFSDDIQEFIHEYYDMVSGVSDDQGRKFEYDYYIQIRNPWKIFYCIDYSRDFYDRLEEKIDSAYSFFMSGKEWRSDALQVATGYEELRLSETFGQRIEIRKSDRLTPSYADKCIAQVCEMPLGVLDRLCEGLIDYAASCGVKTEKYMLNKNAVISELHSGIMTIPSPADSSPAYVLRFDADFTDKGAGIVIRDGEIVHITGRDSVNSPWMFENDLRYRIIQSLKLVDVRNVDALGKALREYSEGTIEQSVIVPYFTGGPVPEENRLFVPAPVAEIKSRNDIIAEKMLHDGTADRYECDPVYCEGSFVPAEVSVSLYKNKNRVFHSEVTVW